MQGGIMSKRITTLEEYIAQCRKEIEALKAQVEELQQELDVAINAVANRLS
jgi:uncharacterized coiled-coil protein SlyX